MSATFQASQRSTVPHSADTSATRADGSRIASAASPRRGGLGGDRRPDGWHGRRPGDRSRGLDWFIVGWAVMMAAMMPSPLPAAVRYARIRSGDSDRHRTSSFGATGLFVAGYLAPWVMVGALAYAVIEVLARLTSPSWPGMRRGRTSPAG